MSNNTNTSSGGIDFLTLLTLLFIGLKLGDVIDWSWYWVLSPIIIPLLFVSGLAAPIVATYYFFSKKDDVNFAWLAVGAGFAAITWGLNYGLYVLIG